MRAATPASGTVSDSNAVTSWQGPLPPVPNPLLGDCSSPNDSACDNFSLTITPPPRDFDVKITLKTAANDYYVLSVFDPTGKKIAGPLYSPLASGATASLHNPAAGVYTVSVAVGIYAETPYNATAEIPPLNIAGTEPVRFVTYAPVDIVEPDAHWTNWAPERGDHNIGLSAPEPSLGVPVPNNLNLQKTSPYLSRAMYVAYTQTLRAEFNDVVSPAIGTWLNKSSPTAITTLDPILEVDQITSRTFSVQLAGKRSLMSLSDDDGETWHDSPQGAGINSGYDHETVGMGPFPASDTIGSPTGYKTASYYASQDDATSEMALSRDGGETWGAAVPMYVGVAQCTGLHGHIEVALDGTVYLPDRSCGGSSGLVRSTDTGSTFQVISLPVPSSSSDTAVATDKAGKLYYATCAGNSSALASTSANNGDTWSQAVDVGAAVGVKNCVFPAVVAGDAGRAAVAFMGSTDAYSSTAVGADPSAFPGFWYVFVAITYDGGASWTTVNATPGDPVQKGSVCLAGTTCAGGRNLADFMDVQKDEKGRVLVGYDDGCVGACVTGAPNSATAYARIARQQPGSRTLYAAFDNTFKPGAPVVPLQPYIEAFQTGNQAASQVTLNWSAPWDGQSAITQYRVFRRTDPGGTYDLTSPLAALASTVLSYVDDTTQVGINYCYKVQAINAVGGSDLVYESCAVAQPVVDVCRLPGALRASGAAGDQVGGPALDLQDMWAAEPFLGATSPQQCTTPSPSKIQFTIQIGDPTTASPGNTWMILWNRDYPDANYNLNTVNARKSATGVDCHWGKANYGTAGATTADDVTALAAADCVLDPAGKIYISLPTSLIDDCAGAGCHVGPGYELQNVLVRSYANTTGSSDVLTGRSANDKIPGLNYKLVGNESCRPFPAPLASDDLLTADLDQPSATLDVMANDTLNSCGTLSIVSVSAPASGTASIVNNKVVYQPSGAVCSDQFGYTVSDGHTQASARVTVQHSRQSAAAAGDLIYTDRFEGGHICPKM